jgi:hypothetical protein
MYEVVPVAEEEVLGMPNPFEHIDAKVMNTALKTMRIKHSWEEMMNVYNTELYTHPDNFFGDIKPSKIVDMFAKVFLFGKSKTPKSMFEAFKNWLKADWSEIHGRSVEAVMVNFGQVLDEWNEANPTNQKSFINLVPGYGGKTEEELAKEQEKSLAKTKMDLE